jgi:drug/metabolite transporter (DMT)-like permease
VGLLYILVAIVGWAVGDFLIQRSVRTVGDWEALFFITLFGAIGLFPFVFSTLPQLQWGEVWALSVTSIVIFGAGLLDFEALRVGKLSVVEPVYALEVPLTVALASLFIGEVLTGTQLLLVAVIVIGVYLVSNSTLTRFRPTHLEKGIVIALLATVGMGTANFLFGTVARETAPLLVNWFSSTVMALGTFAFLQYKRPQVSLFKHFLEHRRLLTTVGLFDNAAWVGYSFAILSMPIGVAIALSESYVAFACMLGIYINKERLKQHQAFGLVLTIAAAMLLGYVSDVV